MTMLQYVDCRYDRQGEEESANSGEDRVSRKEERRE